MPNRAELLDAPVRHAMLLRMRDALDRGERDPELLYLGGRYAASLAMDEEARRFVEPLGDPRFEELLRPRGERRRADVKRVIGRIASSAAGKLAEAATQAYRLRDLAAARLALEDLLLLRADRADVLWNLLVVASEQRDAEGCERYWRRYAGLMLVQVLRREPGAREKLVRFYDFVATATDRPFAEASVKVAETLQTPGLLPRWLEAHAALAWLDEPRPALRKLWFRAFYPELVPFVAEERTAAARSPRPTVLPFDPARKLLTRFAEWSRVQFGLGDDEAHAATIVALAQCAARIRWQPYVVEVTAALRGPELEVRPFRQTMQEAVCLPLGPRMGGYLEKEDWKGLVAFFGDIASGLTATFRLFLALACCHVRDARRGLELALQTLPDLSAKDLEEDSQAGRLWRNVLQANLGAALEFAAGGEKERLEPLREMLRAAPAPRRLAGFLAAREAEIDDLLRQIDQRKRVDAAIEVVKRHLEKKEFVRARAAVHKLEDEPPDLAALKKKLLADITEIETSAIVQQRVHDLVMKGRYDDAHKVLNELPKESRSDEKARAVHSQIDDAQRAAKRHAEMEARIERAVEQAKQHVEKEEFESARRAVRDVPEPLKAQLLSQIGEAEAAARTHAQIESAIETAKKHVSRKEFREARRALAKLPDDLKKKLLPQIDDAENDARTGAAVESAVEQAKQHVAKGRFDQARRAVRDVPEPLKAQFLSQIGEAEAGRRSLNEENASLRRMLSNRGVGSSEIDRLARLNDLDTSNPAALNALLKAIAQQLG